MTIKIRMVGQNYKTNQISVRFSTRKKLEVKIVNVTQITYL